MNKFNLQKRKLRALASFAFIATCSSSPLLALDKNTSSYEETKNRVIARYRSERPGLERFQRTRAHVAREDGLAGQARGFEEASLRLRLEMEDEDEQLNGVGNVAIDLLDQAAENQIENVQYSGLKQKLVNLKNKCVNRFRRIFR